MSEGSQRWLPLFRLWVMKSCARRGCFSILLLCALGGFAWWKLQPPRRIGEAVPFSALPATEKRKRKAEVAKLEQQIREVAASSARGEQRRFTLAVTQRQLNTLLAGSLATGRYPVRNLSAEVAPGLLTVQGDVTYRGVAATATLSGTVTVVKGKLDFKARSLLLGGINAPDDWRQRAQQAITTRLNIALQRTRGQLESVKLGDKVVTIVGVTNR